MSKAKGKKMKKNLWFLLTGFCIGFAPTLFHIADLKRGYNATGGEMAIFILQSPHDRLVEK